MLATPPISSFTTSSHYLYELRQYMKMLKACYATCAISMLCSLIIAVSYLHLRVSQPDRANRVSLRCVFMASIMNLINSIFDIIIALIYGDTSLCRASAIVAMFTRVMSAVFLALVGINLVLVFVCNIQTSANRLEYIYYPSAFLYGLVTIVVPIVESSDDMLSTRNDLRCYYFVHYYQFFGHSSLLWMWYYGFLFLSIMIASICSITALVKLMKEHHTLVGKWAHIASMSQAAESAQSSVEQRIKAQSSIFVRVVSRCVLYPLVPLISNIWGFIFQIYLVNPHNGVPTFAFSLTDVIFRCLQGFFVSIVFFSDPAMTHYISEQWGLCKEKYVDDFSQIRKYSDGQMEVLYLNTKRHNKGSKSQSSSITVMPSSSPSSSSSTTCHKPSPVYHKGQTATQLSVDATENDSINIDWEHKGKRISHDSAPFNTVPMRRLSVPASVYSRIHRNETNQSTVVLPSQSPLSTSSTAFEGPDTSPCNYSQLNNIIPDPSSDHRILVPYKYPRLACAFHWFLVRCGFGKTKSDDGASMNREEPSTATEHCQPHSLSPILDTSSVVDISPSIHPLSQESS
ncbi:unnamed protein product [Mucor circinelloides]|uniref:Uncharacterized protein n=1 Tax=Mucor circinelloides f. circinelloides (strain 1006PhL) TaxID=1220926 RepID=S2JC07_MUCC1|nr:hypothetical protein HMPREF1544_07333 [Mucor circinelloides 1006PhL]